MQMPTSSSYHHQEEEEGSPSFFKVIRYPSAPHLVLPNAFVRRYFKKIPKNPTLVTETQEHSWRMEFVKIGEDYCFANGWEKLVKDVQLCIRDIVVFCLIDSLTFKVCFLGANGCEKDFPHDKTNDDDVVNDDGQDGDIVGGKCHDVSDDDHHHEVMQDKDLCFEIFFSGKTYISFLNLPMKFIRAAELQCTRSITLKDHEGKEWRMRILAEQYKKRSRYCLSAGWSKFRKHHNLSEGDVYKFAFDKNEGVLNITQLIKGKRPNQQDAPMEEVNWIPTRTPHGGGGKLKIEYDSGPEMEGVVRKRGMLKSFENVKIEDVETVVPPERGGGVDVQGWERVIRSKHVIYF